MSIVGHLLDAQRRPREEARRLTEAVGEALLDSYEGDGGGEVPAAAARDAFVATAQEIDEEKNPRPEPTPERRAAFDQSTDDDGSLIRDAENDPEPDVRNDACFGADYTPGEGDDTPPWHVPERVPDIEAGPEDVERDTPNHSDADADADPACDELTPTGPTETGAEGEAVSAGDGTPAKISSDLPSPTDAYDSNSVYGEAPELIPTGSHPPEPTESTTDDAATPSAPEPSTTTEYLHEDYPEPERVDDPSLPQRIRESLTSTLDRFSGSSSRWKLVAGAGALILVVLVVGVFSLSGGRGKPPQPAGIAAPAPSSDTSGSTRESSALVPATVSASCGEDSDPVAAFAGDKSRAWVCRRTRGLDLNVLNITFAKPVVITEITIVPGFNYVAPDGRDEWSRHRLVTGVTWRMGGAVYPQVINPTRTGATMKFPSVITKQMSMTITDSVRPPRSSNPGERSVLGGTDNAAAVDETTAISSIVISGYPVDPGS